MTLFFFLIITSLYFVLFPAADLGVSAYFYRSHHFIWTYWQPASASRHLVYIFTSIAITFLLFIIGKNVFLKKPFHTTKPAIIALLFFITGPLLMTNNIFKNNWGRARPNQITQFGGTHSFTAAWVISTECTTNCSFVCGDSAGALSLLALLFLIKRRRLQYLLGGTVIAFTLWIGLIRLAQGGHFLSDVLISIELNLFLFLLLQYYCLPKHKYTKTGKERN